jgi:hypothetical protein
MDKFQQKNDFFHKNFMKDYKDGKFKDLSLSMSEAEHSKLKNMKRIKKKSYDPRSFFCDIEPAEDS